jgi:hypothetical protein
MRRFALCCCVAVLAGCAKPEQQAARDSTAALAAGATAAPIALADVAGKWTMKTMREGSDSVLISYEMVAGADANGWSFNFPNRQPVPIRVLAVEGDSIVTEAGPYESVLRKGVQVSTHSVMRLQGGNVVGTTVAHYSTTGADSVVYLRTEGTRVP